MDLTTIPRKLNSSDLRLRPLKMTDAEGMYEILSDAESMKYWSNQPVANIDEAIGLLREDLDSDAGGHSMCWAVTLKDDDHLIGKCILFHFSLANARAEIGFILNRKYWRQGYMQQAVEAVISFAFTTLKLHRIEADTDVENAGSQALLDKLGFEREGFFRERWCVFGEWQDSVMLALLNPD